MSDRPDSLARTRAALERMAGPPGVDPAAEVAEDLTTLVRGRLREIAQDFTLATEAAEVRDLGIALAAGAAALEDLERLDERVSFHRAAIERWSRDLRALLTLVGAVDPGRALNRDRAHIAERTVYPVLEGLLWELDDSLAADLGVKVERLELDEPGLFARADELERLLERTAEQRDELQGRVTTLEAELADAQREAGER